MSTPAPRQSAADALLRLAHVGHRYGAVEVLADIDFSVRRGEFVALVGPSGCGKTTLLNLCSGWLTPTTGRVERTGQVRMVFQQDGLFPWMTVQENVHLGLRHVAREHERTSRAASLLALIGLTGFERHYPHQLSGGMRQRVELARALAGDTDVLLMDEPFSSLDYLTRLKLRLELSRMPERPDVPIRANYPIRRGPGESSLPPLTRRIHIIPHGIRVASIPCAMMAVRNGVARRA